MLSREIDGPFTRGEWSAIELPIGRLRGVGSGGDRGTLTASPARDRVDTPKAADFVSTFRD